MNYFMKMCVRSKMFAKNYMIFTSESHIRRVVKWKLYGRKTVGPKQIFIWFVQLYFITGFQIARKPYEVLIMKQLKPLDNSTRLVFANYNREHLFWKAHFKIKQQHLFYLEWEVHERFIKNLHIQNKALFDVHYSQVL